MSVLPLIQDCVLIALDTVGFEVTGGAVLTGNLTDAATTILVNTGGIAYVLADEGNTYSGAGTVEPLASDRAAWDALGYAARHTNDADDSATAIHHTLGTGADQAAAGNHTHSAPSLALDDLSDVTITTPSDDDVLTYSSGSWINAAPGGGTDANAIHDNVSGEIHAITEKTTPADADEIIIEDSEDSYAKKRVQIANLPAGTGGGGSITEGVYSSIPGSPTDGDVYLATDSHVALHRASSAWVPFGPINKLTFPPAISGNWTWANQGTSTADDSLGVIQMVSQLNGGQTLRALYKAAPVSTPYTITALVSFDMGYSVNWLGCGIGFRENSSGKYLVFGPSSSDGACAVECMRWNNTGSYTSALFNDGGVNGGIGHWARPMWLRIKNDGTNLTFWYSNSGILWTQRASTAKNSFFTTGPDGVAMCLYQENNSVQSQAVFWSWEVT